MYHLLVASLPFVIAAARPLGRRILRWIVLLAVAGAAGYAAVHFSRRRHHTHDADAYTDEWPRRPS
jgi:hypothetical protein